MQITTSVKPPHILHRAVVKAQKKSQLQQKSHRLKPDNSQKRLCQSDLDEDVELPLTGRFFLSVSATVNA